MPFDKITLPSVSILECFERVKTLFLNDWKKLAHFGHVVQQGKLFKGSFNTSMGQTTTSSSRKKLWKLCCNN